MDWQAKESTLMRAVEFTAPRCGHGQGLDDFFKVIKQIYGGEKSQ